jgi:predicted DNA-binding antitoxin AbrB/MazE fold protein
MQQVIDAIFEQGAFKVLNPSILQLAEGQQVKLVIEELTLPPDNPLALLTGMYEGLSEEEIDEIERIILNRRDFFGKDLP